MKRRKRFEVMTLNYIIDEEDTLTKSKENVLRDDGIFRTELTTDKQGNPHVKEIELWVWNKFEINRILIIEKKEGEILEKFDFTINEYFYPRRTMLQMHDLIKISID